MSTYNDGKTRSRRNFLRLLTGAAAVVGVSGLASALPARASAVSSLQPSAKDEETVGAEWGWRRKKCQVLKSATYTVTNADNDGDVVIPLFEAHMYVCKLESDAQFNDPFEGARVVVEAEKGDGSFTPIVDLLAPNGISTGDEDFTTGSGPKAGTPKYPWQIRARVDKAPSQGQCEVRIDYI